MTAEPSVRRRSTVFEGLAIITVLAAALAALFAITVVILSGPGWQVSVTNQSDGALVEAFEGDAVEPSFSALLEGRSIPRDVVRATPECFDAEIFKASYHDPTLGPGYWRFEIDGVTIGMSRPFMRVDDELMIDRGETARYPMVQDRKAVYD